MVDFSLSDSQKEVRASARAFSAEVLSTANATYSKLPNQMERFRSTRPLFRKAVAGGLIKGLIPPELGGTGGTTLDVALMLEEMYLVDPSVTITIVACGLGLTPLLLSGKADLQKKYLEPFLKDEGEPIASLMHSEPTGTAKWLEKGGKGLQVTAKKEGDEWVVNGEKFWTTNSGGWDFKGADLACLVCRQTTDGGPQDPTDDAKDNIIIFLVTRELIAKNKPGAYHVLAEPELMGHPAVTGPHTQFTDFHIPQDMVLMAGSEAANLISTAFIPTAALVGVMAVAISRGAFEAALAFAKHDNRGGSVPIIQRPTVADRLTDIKIRTDTSRLLCWKAVHCLDNGPGDSVSRQEICLEAKIYATDMCVDCCTDAMKLVGMQSYRKDLPFIKLLNDAMCMPLFDGGNLGMRRRQMEKIFQLENYSPWASFYEDLAPKPEKGRHDSVQEDDGVVIGVTGS